MIEEFKVEWSGFAGAPGWSTFYARPDNGMVSELTSFFSWFVARIPAGVKMTVPNSGAQLDEVTGETVGVWNEGSAFTATGIDAGKWSAASGAVINWNSSGFGTHGRIKGKTFIVPLGGGAYGTDGTLDAVALGELNDAATGLVAGQNGFFVVWHRPNRTTHTGGSIHDVISHRINDRVAVLPSRRT